MNTNIAAIISLVINYCFNIDDTVHHFNIKDDDLFWGENELPFWFEDCTLMMVEDHKSSYEKVMLGHIDNIDNFLQGLNKAQFDILYGGAYEVAYDPDGDSEMVVEFTEINDLVYYMDEDEMADFGEKVNAILDNMEL